MVTMTESTSTNGWTVERCTHAGGWRLSSALWFVPLLDPYDPSGRHITEEAAE